VRYYLILLAGRSKDRCAREQDREQDKQTNDRR
jgi:hypothetical protein